MSKKSFGCIARCSGTFDQSHAKLWGLREMGDAEGWESCASQRFQEYNPVLYVSLGARGGSWEWVGAGWDTCDGQPTQLTKPGWSKFAGAGEVKWRAWATFLPRIDLRPPHRPNLMIVSALGGVQLPGCIIRTCPR